MELESFSPKMFLSKSVIFRLLIRRCIKMARVNKVKKETTANQEEENWHICFRDKEVNTIYEMFHLRAILHRRAYQHKTSNAVEHMICEALLKADPYLLLEGKDGKQSPVKMSEAKDDMVAYTKLTDEVYYQILHSSDQKLSQAKGILERIERRDLYRFIGERTANEKILDDVNESTFKKDILKKANVDGITEYDIILHEVKFDYGMKKEDPVKKVYFYTKQEPDKAFLITEKEEAVSYMLLQVFIEWKIRLYSRKNLDKDKIKKLKDAFEEWFKQKSAGGDAANGPDETPEKDPSPGSSEEKKSAARELEF